MLRRRIIVGTVYAVTPLLFVWVFQLDDLDVTVAVAIAAAVSGTLLGQGILDPNLALRKRILTGVVRGLEIGFLTTVIATLVTYISEFFNPDVTLPGLGPGLMFLIAALPLALWSMLLGVLLALATEWLGK